MSEEIQKVAMRRKESLGYGSLSSYMVGLIREDCIRGGNHSLGLKIDQMRPWNRDRIDSEILERHDHPSVTESRIREEDEREARARDEVIQIIRPPEILSGEKSRERL